MEDMNTDVSSKFQHKHGASSTSIKQNIKINDWWTWAQGLHHLVKTWWSDTTVLSRWDWTKQNMSMNLEEKNYSEREQLKHYLAKKICITCAILCKGHGRAQKSGMHRQANSSRKKCPRYHRIKSQIVGVELLKEVFCGSWSMQAPWISLIDTLLAQTIVLH